MDQPLKISIDENTHRVTLQIIGDLSKERLSSLAYAAESAQKQIEELSVKTGEKIKILIDMTEFSGIYDVDAVPLMTQFAKHNANFVKKTAGFGSAEKGTISGEIVSALAERENIRFFQTKEEAIAWLEL
jgi:ribosomal protein S13